MGILVAISTQLLLGPLRELTSGSLVSESGRGAEDDDMDLSGPGQISFTTKLSQLDRRRGKG
jgi:hypothetical protein